jgi:glycosyltransferase involved in cell wall biosynthesis
VQPMPDGLAGARRVVPFARLLRRRRPEVFHAHLTWPLACKFGLAGAVLARVPAVVATQQLIPQFVMTRSTRLQQRLLGARVGRYIAVSKDTALGLQALFPWPSDKITVVPNAVDVRGADAPLDSDLRSRLSRGHRAVVLVAARLDPLKGHRYLLDAARSLDGVHIVLAGDGPERAALEARVRELGLEPRVTFLGFREDVPRLMRCADVVVLPSLVEGLPLTVLEAMAARVPVVATAIGGTDEAVVDGMTGVLVPPGDAAALANAVERLLSNPQLARRLSEAGAARIAEHFTAERMVARVEAVYDELLERRRR